jgi:hypothetical protein
LTVESGFDSLTALHYKVKKRPGHDGKMQAASVATGGVGANSGQSMAERLVVTIGGAAVIGGGVCSDVSWAGCSHTLRLDEESDPLAARRANGVSGSRRSGGSGT